jgi:hypothetical protein
MLHKFTARRAKRRFLMDASDRAVAHEEQITREREERLAVARVDDLTLLRATGTLRITKAGAA